MSIEIAELRSIIGDSLSGSQFSLVASQLKSDAINAISDQCFPNNTIKLAKVAPIQESTDGMQFTVQGTGVDLPFRGMSVTVQLCLEDNDVVFDLTAIGDSRWTISTSFPILERTIASTFSFKTSAPPQLRLLSHLRERIQPGLSFNGTLDLSAMTGDLAKIAGRYEQRLTGTLEVEDGGLTLLKVEFTAPISEKVNLGIATVDELTFKVGSNLTYDFIEQRLSAVPYIGLGAKIPFSARQPNRSIPIAVEIADLGRDVRFSADLTEAIDAGLHEISNLTNKIGLDAFIPTDFHLEDVITLHEFFFDCNTGNENFLNMIGVGIKSTNPWEIKHPNGSNRAWQVENVSLTFRLRDPFGVKKGSMALSGELVFGSAGRLVVDAFYPDYSIEASLKEGTELRLDEIIAELVGPDASIPKIDVYSLDLKLAAGNYSLNAEVEGHWPIGDLPFALEEITLTLVDDGTENKNVVAGQFRVADVGVYGSAQYLGADGGWQFKGGTGKGQAIPIGTLIRDLADAFGSVTLPQAIADLKIQDLEVSFNTHTKNFLFTCHAKFTIDDQQVDISVTIDIENEVGSYKKTFGGTITIGSLEFKLTFLQNQASNIFVAAYTEKDDKKLKIKDLVAYASSSLAEPIPDSLTIDLKDVIFAYSKVDKESKFLFGMDVGAGINLSNLPLVGQVLPPDQTLSVDDLRLVVASKGLTQSEVTSFNNLLPEKVARLAASDEGSTESDGEDAGSTDTQIAIREGLSVSAKMKFGSSTRVLGLPVAGANQSGTKFQQDMAAPVTESIDTSTADSAKWFTLQKTFGPVYFEKVGVQYKNDELWFLLSGSLSVGGLTLELDGLACGSPLKEFRPEFDLRGLGIDYKNGPIEIGGAFLRTHVGEGAEAHDEYTGEAIIKTGTLTLSAIGSYTKLEGHPSLLIYAMLDYPIGGPAFCFVTGLAAGFGYNRSLKIPSLDQLTKFPLIAQAIEPPDPRPTLGEQSKNLQKYIPATIDQSFFAVGIRFTSFKMIDSFALLTISFGRRFAVDLLGISTLVAPTPEEGTSLPPVAVVRMAIRVRFAPDEGFLGIDGQLTSDSYILSKDCHLTGGFAFYSWFSGDHAGDFVQTLGGYHPRYNVPAHYPKVPRVGINWRVDNSLSLKAEAYYALTASALMVGGHMQATWESGNLKASFNVAVDFLISWKPYHYEADVSVGVHVSYTYHLFGTQHLDADVGAALHIWGPEFSGKAHITLSIISFDVEFGPHAPSKPEAIGWAAFKKSFLPPDKDICSINVKDGLVSTPKAGGATDWVVNPKNFSFIVNSVIPSKEAYKGTSKASVPEACASFGIGSMEVRSDNLSTRQTITIKKNGVDVAGQFTFEPILKKAPTGMWGTSLTPSLNGQNFITNTLAGFEIRPAQQPDSPHTADIELESLFTVPSINRNYSWQTIKSFISSRDSDEPRSQIIKSIDRVAKVRGALLSDLGFTDEIDVNPNIADAFLIAPRVGNMAS